MDLILRVIEGPPGAPAGLSARFGADGGLIGRAESARLTLPDPARIISRFHLHVSHDEGAYFVEEMGSTNTAAINGARMVVGQRSQLRPGDQLRIGHYTLAIEFDDPDFPATDLIDRQEADEPPRDDAAAGQRGAEELLRAFMIGAQLADEIPPAARARLMQAAGASLRAAVAGLRRCVALHSAAPRSEAELEASARHPARNPLHFAADDARALAAVLRPVGTGFASGAQAITEVAGELAALIAAQPASARSAAARIVSGLDPAAIEAALGAPNLLDGLLPARRKALLWDAYVRACRARLADGEQGLVQAFERAYAEACEASAARSMRPKTLG